MTYYDIFCRCFPELSLTEEEFGELSGLGGCEVLEANGGFALVQRNKIRLLCVLPEFRGKGTGGALLSRCEELILASGYTSAEVGGTDSRLFIGAVGNSADFFEKRGYILDDMVADMCGEAGELKLDMPLPAGVEFGNEPGGSERLKAAVSSVDEDWVQYFGEGEIFCAYSGGEIASFCTIEDDVTCIFSDGKTRMGSIGCVGTVPEFRRRGIGLAMVAEASRELLRRGCGKIFIHYTGVYDWYARIGYRTRVWLKLGGKRLAP